MKAVNKTLRFLILGVVAAVLFGAGGSAKAQTMNKLYFDDLVDHSDLIFSARCVERKTSFESGNIVTKYRLKPIEILKGQPRLNNAGEIEMQELGGALEGNIPLAQASPIMANIYNDEEVLLFTEYPKPRDDKSTPQLRRNPAISPDSPRLVGGPQGRFRILRHPETGVRVVVRTGVGNPPVKPLGAQPERVAARLGLSQPEAPEAPLQLSPDQRGLLLSEIMKQNRKKGSRLDRVAATARQARDAAAAAHPERAAEIYQFENLASVEQRVRESIARRAKQSSK